MAAKAFTTPQLRNIVLVGHGGCGKTSLAEACLFLSGATSRLGRIDDKTSTLDYEPEEQKRGGSIATTLAWLEHSDHKINLLDTPGDQNFIYDSFNAMRGADAVVVVVSAPDGVEVQTRQVYKRARALGLPVVFFINKMDRDRADAAACLAEMKETLDVTGVPLQVPIGSESSFSGVVSLLQRKAFTYPADRSGVATIGDVPDDLADVVEGSWESLVEAVAETDEDLLMEYLDTFELSEEQVRTAFRAALKGGHITPVLFGAATNCVGAAALLDLATWAFPSPAERDEVAGKQGDEEIDIACDPDGPFASQVIHTTIDEFSGKLSILRLFRGTVPSDNVTRNPGSESTERLGALYALRGKERDSIAAVCGDIVGVAKLKDTRTGDTLCDPKSASVIFDKVVYPPPMMAYAITPASKSDADKIKVGIDRLLEEDPTLSTSIDGLTGKMVLNGMGQAHLDMAIERMRRKFKVNVTCELPPVPYRETLRKPARNIEGKHKKQTGGAGQFGVAYFHALPLERDGGFEFVNQIKGGSIPNQFIPSVEKGIRSRMQSGFLAGYPVVDIRIELYDGKYHPVDSKDVAFQLAGSKGMKTAFEKGGTVLLEPMMDMEIAVPTEVMGDIMGDISGRRGRVSGMENRGKTTVVRATVPLASVQRYAPDLKGMSGGKGAFIMQLAGYEEVPRNFVGAVVAASPFKKDDED